jgi:hypothetical protein
VEKMSPNSMVYNCFLPFGCCSIMHPFVTLFESLKFSFVLRFVLSSNFLLRFDLLLVQIPELIQDASPTIFHMEKFFDLHQVLRLEKVNIASLYLENDKFVWHQWICEIKRNLLYVGSFLWMN